MIRANIYFNPADSPFEVLGFFEEYIQFNEASGESKLLGYKLLNVDEAPRPLGSDGRLSLTLTEPVTLRKGTREVVVKASKSNPITVFSMVQARCGQAKYVSPPLYKVATNVGGTMRRVWKISLPMALPHAQNFCRDCKRGGYRSFIFPNS